MKQKHLIGLFMGLVILMGACSSDMPFEPVSSEAQNREQTSLSLEQALERGNQIYDEFFKDVVATRGLNRQIESVDCITNVSRTRALNVSDTLFYVVNYADNAGFMMVSADSRLKPVYALSDEGRLDFADTIHNKGLLAFYSNSVASASYELSSEGVASSLIPGEPIDPEPTPLSVGPLLTTYQQNIGQGYPYNTEIETLNGAYKLVGCPAVAMEQVMSYYKYPYRPNGFDVDWDRINSGDALRQLCIILSRIGKTIHTIYGIYGSGIEDPIQIVNGFRDMYDYNPGKETLLASDVAANDLMTGPVLLYTKQLNPTDSGGHVWVVDGYKRTSGYSYMGATYYLHCVWGWYGQSNGYYLWNFDKFIRYPDSTKEFDPQYPVYMLRGLRPQYNFEL